MSNTDTQPDDDGSTLADEGPTAADGPSLTTADASTVDSERVEADPRELAAQVELLAAENRRLREEYARARQSRYRSTALGLAVVGLVAVAGSVLFPDAREVLVALGATGLFGAVLTYYLTPSQVVDAAVGERSYAAGAMNLAAITAELGLRDDRVYLPREGAPARLYVPQHAEYDLPEESAGPIVVDDGSRGLLLEATGANLYREFERGLPDALGTEPATIANQATDALVEQFELVTDADADVDPAAGRVTVAVTDTAFGDVDRFDHPIPSFLAVAFAVGLDRPVQLEVTAGDDRADWLITCRWDVAGASATDDESAR